MKESTKEKMSLSPVELADELSMINKEYLIVEGQSDKCFWEHLHQEGLKKRQIRVANKKQCSGNKEYVKRVISIMNERRKNNTIGVIDLDYDFVRNKIEIMENLYYYKYIDLENVLLQSTAFSEVNTLISSLEKKLEDDVLKDTLYKKAYLLGILRLLNDIEGCNFCFEGLDYKKLINDGNEKFLEYFMSRMNLKKTEREDVSLKINLLLKEDNANEYICNGHDLISILSELTRRTISTDNPIKYTEEILEKMLILGYRTVVNTLDVQNCVDIILT